jgi:hypothetical protein
MWRTLHATYPRRALDNDSLEGDKIEVSASDLPGNITVEELNL